MSATITTDIVCDFCGNWVHGCTHPTSVRLNEAREEAKQHGWFRFKHGVEGHLVDCCPRCADISLTNVPGYIVQK